ncbi:trypsin-like peptidase domain-containing protein [Robertkochia solimangrovi]|uniref:trypsin-like peptidase domain-containing protein n=1 Tax=Robertkochia solimangrovi TaxID=2213046 RepID=UPI00117E9E51|nr:trypsin-like peptidase domain-containing protein [Robertkochia solimangrovi]TRZ41100.1 serine protease [Robertkochia solimangrovi]
MKRFSSLLLVAILAGAITLGAYKLFFEQTPLQVTSDQKDTPFVTANYNANALRVPENINFTKAAEETVHAVVHVKNVTISKGPSSIMDYFYGSGGAPRAQVGTGSGVIISPDGYIVTNNHVIANASELQVTLNNNKTFKAELVGSDPETDIALIKINADDQLPYLPFGDSNQTRIGEWVLAVGNPFNLTSTVTAGIISAKARDLNEGDQNFQSFIQTDAAVNPGNSGGALVNINGELIGINTAITSQTGSYVGYSFAVPSNIAKKVVEDLMEFGNVQVGNIGIRGADVSRVNMKEVSESEGVYVAEVIEDSGADMAGLKTGDIIKSVDGIRINKFSDLTGYLRSKRPDDKVELSILRNDDYINVPVTLVKDTSYQIDVLGLSVKEQTESDRKRFKNKEGVKIIDSGRFARTQGIAGKLLVGINDENITDINDVKTAMSNAQRSGYLSITLLNEQGEKERLIFHD